MKKHRILICCLVCAMLIACFAAIPALGATPESCSLTLEYADDNAGALDGCTFRLFMVAEGGQNGYRLTEAFAKKQADVDGTDWFNAEQVFDLAESLTVYLTDGEIMPDAAGITDAEGRTCFENLPYGLYLVLGDDLVKGEWTYTAQQILIWLPCADPDGGVDYTPVCAPKHDRSTEPTKPGPSTGTGTETDKNQNMGTGAKPDPKPETVDVSVVKVWVDDGDHPSTVTIQLLCDEEVFDEITLSEQNDWKYLWEGLDAGRNWQVEEKNVPEGYTAKVTRSGNAFTVTNTKKLPQTGQLWWPVSVMLGAGLVLLLAGLALLKRGKKKAGGLGSES